MSSLGFVALVAYQHSCKILMMEQFDVPLHWLILIIFSDSLCVFADCIIFSFTDNWALLYAQRMALKQEVPLIVCFCLPSKYLNAAFRQYSFMITGLQEVEKVCAAFLFHRLATNVQYTIYNVWQSQHIMQIFYLQPYNFFQELTELNIPFHMLLGEPDKVLPDFIKTKEIGGVVTDFTPMRTPLKWLENAAKKLPKNVPLCQVCILWLITRHLFVVICKLMELTAKSTFIPVVVSSVVVWLHVLLDWNVLAAFTAITLTVSVVFHGNTSSSILQVPFSPSLHC